MQVVRNITVNLSPEDVESIIIEHLNDEGYKVKTPDFHMEVHWTQAIQQNFVELK